MTLKWNECINVTLPWRNDNNIPYLNFGRNYPTIGSNRIYFRQTPIRQAVPKLTVTGKMLVFDSVFKWTILTLAPSAANITEGLSFSYALFTTQVLENFEFPEGGWSEAQLGLLNSFPSSLFMRAGQGYSSGLHCSELWRTICGCGTASVALEVSRDRKTLDEGDVVCFWRSKVAACLTLLCYIQNQYNLALNKHMEHSWNYTRSHLSSSPFYAIGGLNIVSKKAQHKNLSWAILTLKSRSQCTIRPFMGSRVPQI